MRQVTREAAEQTHCTHSLFSLCCFHLKCIYTANITGNGTASPIHRAGRTGGKELAQENYIRWYAFLYLSSEGCSPDIRTDPAGEVTLALLLLPRM